MVFDIFKVCKQFLLDVTTCIRIREERQEKSREKVKEEYGKMQGVQQPGTIFDLLKNIKVYTKMFSNYEGASGTFLNL